MKVYRTLLISTFLFSFYSWIYEGYLHESLYGKYMPDYCREVTFPTYNLKGEVANLQDNRVSDHMMSYVPWYGQILYYMRIGTVFLVPVLLVITLITGIYVCYSYKLYRKPGVLLVQVLVFIAIWLLIRYTPFMD